MLSLVLIGAGAWLVTRIVSAVVESTYARYATSPAIPPGYGGCVRKSR